MQMAGAEMQAKAACGPNTKCVTKTEKVERHVY